MTANPPDWDVVGRSSYVSLTSYRKDGRPVATPIWIAPAEGKLYFFSEVAAYKVKRIRRNPDVTLQPCDVRGKLAADSPVVAGTARILAFEDTPRVRKIVNHKYWLLGPLSQLGVWVTRRQQASFAIEISPRTPAQP